MDTKGIVSQLPIHNDTTNIEKIDDKVTDFKIVGIGASAGSLEVLNELFEDIYPMNGMAYIIVQHLSPNYKSHMKDLLSKKTNMKIVQTTNQMVVEPNHIYLIPPQHNVTLCNRVLELSEYTKGVSMNFPIDHFFTSLAEEKGSDAVAIILSGKGWDGTKGVESVFEAGGTVIIQSEKTAKFKDMPRNAIQTGKVDHVFSAKEMATFINEISNGKKPTDYTNFGDQDIDDILTQIFALINRKSGVDFSSYKKASILRRIEKRVNVNQLNFKTLHEYKEYLIGNPSEIVSLQNDLLINVTEFFRDKKAFEIIEHKVIPEIVNEKIAKGEQEIRLWVAGCSTGEEAYSLAMLLAEYLEDFPEPMDFKIFATDLDKEAIKKASEGAYIQQSVIGITEERLKRFFIVENNYYKVRHTIREKIIFAPHNIAKDSPFVNLDFISCRNMLIYFQPDLQKKILSMFHFSLQTNGYLFLGPSESVNKLTNLFHSVDPKWKLYKNINGRESKTTSLRHLESKSNDMRTSDQMYQSYLDNRPFKRLDDVYKILLEQYIHPFIIVDNENNVVISGGNVTQFLRIPHGSITFNILKLLPTHLSVAINTALKKVRDTNEKIVYPNLKMQEGNERIHLKVEPFGEENQHLTFICFEIINTDQNVKSEIEANEYDLDDNIQQLIIDLENELSFTKEHLQTTIEELETSNEEYQSTNEELIAANEEMQSSNEELQSVNDELLNVNAEHEEKIQQLIDLNNDMDNLLVSTNVATVFLDEDLKIKRFTPQVTVLINLLEVDIGRPLSHISHHLLYDDLLHDAADVLRKHHRLQKEVNSKDGKWYSLRIYPYRTRENYIKGVVITFVDITDIKKTNNDLILRSFALEQSPASIVITNTGGEIEYVNARFTEQLGYSKQEVVGAPLHDILNSGEGQKEFQNSWDTVSLGKKWSGDCLVQNKKGQQRWESVVFLPIINSDDSVTQYLRVAEDITDRKIAEDLLRKSEMLSALGELAAGIAHEIRNPLTALKGFIQLMQAEGDSNQSYLGIMLSEFNRIESIINELLVLARPHVVKYEDTNINTVLHDVTMLLETQAIISNISIQSNYGENLPTIQCVEKEIKQVVINLIKNAIEAMTNGGTISITTSEEERFVVIEVQDEGKGIPKDRMDKIGQPFYTTKEKGTGLGLMVSYRIIENHNGLMLFESEENKGTKVTLKLPIQQ